MANAVVSWVGARFPTDIPRITLVFGSTTNGGYSERYPHNGLDVSPYAGAFGAPIYAAWSGIVTGTGEHPTAGKYVIYEVRVPFDIGASDLTGKWRQFKAGQRFQIHNYHLQEIYVKHGQVIRVGDKIGANGSTGKSTGAHLHFEARALDTGTTKDRVDPLHLLIATIPGLQDELIYTAGSS